jgi:hypothetical protein
VSGKHGYGEPWQRGDYEDEANDVRGDLAMCAYGEGPEDVERARRAIACVNACAGIPTEALEAGALADAIQAAQDLFPFGPEHRTSLLRGEVCGRLHDALKRLEPSP